MPSFADRNRASMSQPPPISRPPGAMPAAAPTWGRSVNPATQASGNVVGPVESGPSLFATVATLAAVGGMLWWVTSGPKVARGNPVGDAERKAWFTHHSSAAVHSERAGNLQEALHHHEQAARFASAKPRLHAYHTKEAARVRRLLDKPSDG